MLEALEDNAGCRTSFLNFDTGVSIQAYGEPPACARALEAARALCDRYERLFSRTLAGSDIWRLNHAEGRPVQIERDTAELLQAAIGYCRASDGSFDISVEPLVSLWNVREVRMPADADVRAALSHVGYETLFVFDRGKVHWAQLRDPAARIDLGGIAKGWIADRLCDLLEGAGVTGVLVNLGGNVCARGSKPDGRPWKIGIRSPFGDAPGPWQAPIIELDEGSVVTSGTYERYFEAEGRRYGHIIDPKTGYPIEPKALSASVVAPRSIDAEGFSTTFLALGYEASRGIMARHPELTAACFVYPDGSVRTLHG